MHELMASCHCEERKRRSSLDREDCFASLAMTGLRQLNATTAKQGNWGKMRETHGFTLLEVVLSLFILALVFGPFLQGLVSQAKVGEDTEKLQMAIKILQSVKEEVSTVRFKDFWAFADKNKPDADGNYNLDDMFWPHSKEEVLDYQRKYRDFDVTGMLRFVPRQGREAEERSLVYFKVNVTWTQPNMGKQKRSTSMMVVEPKS